MTRLRGEERHRVPATGPKPREGRNLLRPQREGRAPARPFGEATLLSLPTVGRARRARRPHHPPQRAQPRITGYASCATETVETAFHRRPLPSEELGKPERPPATYATAYRALSKTSPKLNYRHDTKVALRGQVPRGVSSDHVCNRAFGDAFDRT